MITEEPRAFVFQYTNNDHIGDQLANTKEGDVLDWLWSETFEINEGDWVFFLRTGDRPKLWRGPWRGFVGMGQVTGPPFETRGRQTPEVIPVATRYLDLRTPLTREMFWHHHLVPRHPFLMTGAQGTNFRIEPRVGTLLAREILTRATKDFDKSFFLPFLDEPAPDDTIWLDLQKDRPVVSAGAAIALHSIRAMPVSGRLEPADMLAAIVRIAGWKRPVPSAEIKYASNFRSIIEGNVGPNASLPALEPDLKNPFGIFKDLNPTEPNDTLSRVLELTLNSARLSNQGDQATRVDLLDLILGVLYSSFRYLPIPGTNGIDVEAVLLQMSERLRSDGDSKSAVRIDRFIETSGGLKRDSNTNQEGLQSEISGNAETRQTHDPNENDKQPVSDEENGASVTHTHTQPPLRIISTAPTRNDDPYSVSVDHLNVDAEARAFARLIASSTFKPPLAIGVFGRWGSGKTFFMSRIEKELKAFSPLTDPISDEKQPADSPSDNGFCTHVVRIRFNAWHYMETNVWASLVDVIFKQLDAWLRKGDAEEAHKSADSLFDSLSTAQEMKLEAIEALADRLRDAEVAREKLETAKQEIQKRGPSSMILWRAIRRRVRKKLEPKFQTAAKEYGFDKVEAEGEKLKGSIDELRKTMQDGNLLWRSFKNRAMSGWYLIALVPVLIGATWLLPMALEGIGVTLSDVSTTLSSIFVTLSVWTAFVSGKAALVVNELKEFDAEVRNEENDLLKSQIDDRRKAEASLHEAETQLEVAEKAAAEAQRQLWEGSAIGRINAFIRRKAEGDEYSRHLGVIATIRRDFEQLSALMSQTDSDDSSKKAWDEQRALLEAQAEALEKRYRRDRKEPVSASDPVIAALKNMKETLETEAPPERRIERIVLFIDDLDRCPPEKVYDVLQAVHLFLAFRLFVIVVGVDTRWMETSLEKMLDKLVSGENGARPRDYLEKIFQIPYWTRPMEETASQAFVSGLLDGIQTRDADNERPPQPPVEPTEPANQDTDDLAAANDTESLPEKGPGTDAPSPLKSGMQTVLYRPETDLASEDEPAGDGTESQSEEMATEDDNREERRPRVFEAVSFTQEEKDFMRTLAPFAGDTPRQALRFVNVYGLVKSVIEESEDEAVQAIDRFALLAQLAIATGSQEAAPGFFNGINAGSEMIADIIEPTASALPVSGPDRHRIRNILLAYASKKEVPIMELVKKLADDEASSRNGMIKSYFDEKQLTENLKAAAPIARRYTFAA
jgi:hypothetical protein